MPVKQLVVALGIDCNSQNRKLKNDPSKWGEITLKIKAKDGKLRNMICIPVEKIEYFLNSINSNKIREDRKKILEKYNQHFFLIKYNQCILEVIVN